MQLDDRKTIILQAIIRNYLETGEPVGSRTISKYTDLNLSSATIRNEMADLEEMGYIIQPHTSAGRIPSDKGYRFYVDTMMATREQEVNEMKDMLLERQDKLENLLKQVVKLPLLSLFVGIVFVGILVIGYSLNSFGYWFCSDISGELNDSKNLFFYKIK